MISYRIAEDSEVDALGALCGESFKDYPLFKLALRRNFRNDEQYYEFVRELYKCHVRALFKKYYSLIAVDNNKIIACAFLRSPNTSEVGVMDYMRSGIIKLMFKAGIRPILKFLSFMEDGEKVIKTIDNTWYVDSFAVDNSYQGKQVGSGMMQNFVKPFIAKQGGDIITLITNAEINRKFYTKNGFSEIDGTTIGYEDAPIGNWSYKMQLSI